MNIKRILEVAQGIKPSVSMFRIYHFVDGKPQIMEEHETPHLSQDMTIYIVTTKEEKEYVDRLNEENEEDDE